MCLERQPLTHFDGAVIYLFASSFRRIFPVFFLFPFARFDYAAETELPNELENEMQSKIYVPHWCGKEAKNSGSIINILFRISKQYDR